MKHRNIQKDQYIIEYIILNAIENGIVNIAKFILKAS